jgi:hypothetical protein
VLADLGADQLVPRLPRELRAGLATEPRRATARARLGPRGSTLRAGGARAPAAAGAGATEAEAEHAGPEAVGEGGREEHAAEGRVGGGERDAL